MEPDRLINNRRFQLPQNMTLRETIKYGILLVVIGGVTTLIDFMFDMDLLNHFKTALNATDIA
jgi:hypothetical protein